MDKGMKKEEDATTKSKDDVNVSSKLIALVISEIGPMSIGCVAMLASTVFNSAVPRVLGKMIDSSSNPSSSSSSSSKWLSLPYLVVIGGGLSSFLRTYCLKRSETIIFCKLRLSTFRAMLLSPPNSPLLNLESLRSVEEDASMTAKTVTMTVSSLLRSLSSVMYSTYFMVKLDSALFALSLGMIPLIGTSAICLSKYLNKLRGHKRDSILQCEEMMEERLRLIKCVQIHNQEWRELAQAQDLLIQAGNGSNKVHWAEGGFMGFLFASTTAAGIAVVKAGSKSVVSGRISPGGLTSFATFSFLLGMGTSGLMKAMGDIKEGKKAAKRLFSIIGPDNLISNMTTAQAPPSPSTSHNVKSTDVNSITFQNVCFQFKSDMPNILSNVSFSITPNKIIAIVGHNGSGKSTIANLLSGLISPTSGEILVNNNTPLHHIDKHTQRDMIGIVPQEPALFKTNVRHNITYSNYNNNISDNQMTQALETAKATDFVTDLDEQILKDGMNFSGGQRQKLALVRVLLHDPTSVLVLDEPMNNLDVDGEDTLENILTHAKDNEGCNRGILLITHREKFLKYVDEILVLEKGAVVYRGASVEDLKLQGWRGNGVAL